MRFKATGKRCVAFRGCGRKSIPINFERHTDEIQANYRRAIMKDYETKNPVRCMECKHFQLTRETADGNPYDLGGICHNPEIHYDYMNGGCDACSLFEMMGNGKE